jgi:hypothetical protein
MSKHTLSHASTILAGDGVAFNLNDPDFGMGGELDNTLRGIRIAVLVTEAIEGGGTDNQLVAANQQPAAGTADQDLLINGTDAVDGVGIMKFCGRVSITSAGVDSGRLFTVLGRDANGRPQAEEITGPNTTTVEGVKHFTKIDRVIVDADTAAVVSVGQLETGPRGLRRKALAWGLSHLGATKAHTYIAVEGSTPVITGSFDGGNNTTQTATSVDQRADYVPIALTEDIEVTYLADLTKEGIGENYTDSRQRVPSAI